MYMQIKKKPWICMLTNLNKPEFSKSVLTKTNIMFTIKHDLNIRNDDEEY